MSKALEILEKIKEYSQTSIDEIKKARLDEIRNSLKILPYKEIEHILNLVPSLDIFPKEIAEEIKFEYVHRGGKL
jgi:hypothetical protein